MAGEETKELILQKSLELFSTKGYAALSMRDLAKEVGIQSSTIYYYFKSKQDIFNALVQKANQLSNEMVQSFYEALNSSKKIDCKSFVKAGVFFVTGYLLNDKIAPLLQTLESERFHNKEADTTWQKMLFLVPISHDAKVFKLLYEKHLIKNPKAQELAIEYHGIVMLGYFTGNIKAMSVALETFFHRVFENTGVQ